MDPSSKFLKRLVLVFFLSLFVLSKSEASRPLMGKVGEGFIKKGLDAVMDSLALGAIKNSGPSPVEAA
ncbi:uncharacterized protein A4U43_C01F1580 [Asparagus officinalis]|uniref:Uncharacterized protein n=1 Tax=Asparagus officinalis TaxID=4686 RepID=A0A5P1FLK5_ASPOF|nr:uncharacterized protein A4U43_C01F1580 [Asparagus officinalis]